MPACLVHASNNHNIIDTLILPQYAPEAPYDGTELLQILSQLIHQLANLAHCTSESQVNYQHYHRLLELLPDVKIGIILVELTKTLETKRWKCWPTCCTQSSILCSRGSSSQCGRSCRYCCECLFG